MTRLLAVLCVALAAAAVPDLEKARDSQDRPALERVLSELSTAAQKSPDDPEAHYRLALASSYLAEISLEVRDRNQARRVAENGIRAAERAVALKAGVAEYHRVLGTLCGQVIPANVLFALSYGKRSQEAIAKAIELDPKSSKAYLARGVGNFYLPDAFGGGPAVALRDIEHAIELDQKSAEAYLWRGLALRKLNRNAEARQAFTKSLDLHPNRVWTKQQLDKTPVQ